MQFYYLGAWMAKHKLKIKIIKEMIDRFSYIKF